MKQKVDLILFTDNLVTCRGEGAPKRGKALADVGLIKDAGVAIKDGIIVKIGSRSEIKESFEGEEKDFGDRVIMPGLIDSHTHPVYAGNRVREFILRARGATYQEIHAEGGGIQFTVDNTRKASFEELYEKGKNVLERMLRHGTTTAEGKSGYGLETEEELRELRVLKKLDENLAIDVYSTFLGAHSLPREYKENRAEFIRIVVEEMMPKVKEENLAKFVDVFCEEGAFTVEETKHILEEGKKMGFGLKLHAEEFTNLGSAVMAGEMGAVSVDHLLRISESDIEKLAKTNTVLTLMPSTLFFLDYNEFAPARKIIDGGACISLATDFNAGSCMSASMAMAMSLGCIKMKMLPEEAINAATYNAAYALGAADKIGSIEEGKQADLVVFDTEDYRLIPYHFGENLVTGVVKKGKIVV